MFFRVNQMLPSLNWRLKKMKNRIVIRISSAISMLALFTAVAGAQTSTAKIPVNFTEKDRDFALKYLNDTKADFVKELTGLSDAQLNFRASPNRWTVAEVAEHIIVSESALGGLIQNQILKSPAVETDVLSCKG